MMKNILTRGLAVTGLLFTLSMNGQAVFEKFDDFEGVNSAFNASDYGAIVDLSGNGVYQMTPGTENTANAKAVGVLNNPIASNTVGTLYYQIYLGGFTGGADEINCSVGLTGVDNGGSSAVWGNFAGYNVFTEIVDGAVTNLGMSARDGEGATLLANATASSWYDVWLVFDNASLTYDVYMSGDGLTGQQLMATAFAFRKTDAGDLDNFAIQWHVVSQHGSEEVYIDNVYVDNTGENLTTPSAVLPTTSYVSATPTDWNAPSAWSDGAAPSSGKEYVASTGVALNTPSTTDTFSGNSLTLAAPQRMEVMATGANVVTVENLFLDGADVSAGIVDVGEAKLDGNIRVLSDSRFSGSTSNSRDLRILSKLLGDNVEVELSATGKTIYIDNPENTLSGTWVISDGTGEFTSAGAIGYSSIIVSNGTLKILGNWDGLATEHNLTVIDNAGAAVELGTNEWTVSTLMIGNSNVLTGFTYDATALSAIGVATFTGTGTIQVGVPYVEPTEEGDLIMGMDMFDNTTAPTVSFTAPNISATATASAVGGTVNWANNDSGSDPGRGSSEDTTWGSHTGSGHPASAVTDVGPANFTLTNAKTDGEITFTIINNGNEDIELGMFHFDASAFRSKAARTFALNVLEFSDITVGNVFTSEEDAITVTGLGHDLHDEYDLDLTGLEDHTLEAGGTVMFQLAFSGGAGDGSGGHHLFLDNIALSAKAETGPVGPPVMEADVTDGNMTITWTSEGSFKLQTRENLTLDDWTDVPGATSSPVVLPATNNLEFLRLIEQ